MLKRFLKLVPYLVLLFFCSLGYLRWNFDRPPLALKKSLQLQPGMTTNQVRAILGKPGNISQDGQTWSYSRPLAWPIFYVYFDPRGHYLSNQYDF